MDERQPKNREIKYRNILCSDLIQNFDDAKDDAKDNAKDIKLKCTEACN
jgi:hypothetical protein